MSAPVTWLKAKYRAQRSKGKNASKHNDGRRRRRRFASDVEKRAMHATQPEVVLVIGPTGKRRFERRERQHHADP